MSSSSEITQLLVTWCDGDQTALEKLVPLVEKEMRRLAHLYMRREGPGHALQTTALVNEAFAGLIGQNRVRWQNRAHFFGITAQIMRRVLLNYARDKKRVKRGGGALQVSLTESDIISPQKSVELTILDEALNKLALVDERKSRVVELRFFGGLSIDETAEVLKVAPITVMRDWNMAKAWLAREISNQQ